MSRPMVTGVIGAGAISGIYLKNMIRRFPDLEVKSIASAHMENARKKAEEFGLRAVTVEEMLDDPDIGMVIVLTPVGSHEGLIRQALEHGKHVYTEKTLTDSPKTARRLLELADAKGLWLGSAPDTLKSWMTACWERFIPFPFLRPGAMICCCPFSAFCGSRDAGFFVITPYTM